MDVCVYKRERERVYLLKYYIVTYVLGLYMNGINYIYISVTDIVLLNILEVLVLFLNSCSLLIFTAIKHLIVRIDHNLSFLLLTAL